jgi:hypothetical protein
MIYRATLPSTLSLLTFSLQEKEESSTVQEPLSSAVHLPPLPHTRFEKIGMYRFGGNVADGFPD